MNTLQLISTKRPQTGALQWIVAVLIKTSFDCCFTVNDGIGLVDQEGQPHTEIRKQRPDVQCLLTLTSFPSIIIVRHGSLCASSRPADDDYANPPRPHGKKRLAVPSLMRVVVGVIAIVVGVVVVDAAVIPSYL